MSDELRLRLRVVSAAEAALADQQYVSAIDIYTRIGLLSPVHVEAWRQGRIDCLEPMIQGNPKKVSLTMELFHNWAIEKGLKPCEIQYARHTRTGALALQFSPGGDPVIEAYYIRHYLAPGLSEHQQQQLTAKLSRAPEPVVFLILRDSACSECGAELPHGSFLMVEGEKPLCVACAGLADLVYLPAGDAGLTRRATKHSGRTFVVVRFSRSRGRYERQGILVKESALERAGNSH